MRSAEAFAVRAARITAAAVAFALACTLAGALEFSLDGPSVELRRLQPCAGCGRPLVVTHVDPARPCAARPAAGSRSAWTTRT